MKDILQQYFGELITAFIGAMAWLFERRKRTIEQQSSEEDVETKRLENFEKKIKIYQDTLDDLTKRYADMIGRENGEMKALADKIEELEKKLKDVEAFWKSKYTQLKKEFEAYKKTHS